jgi:L-amino acid N-acyltransferase YncA
MLLTPEQIADKLIRRGGAAIEDYRAGVTAVTESPTVAAARKIDKMQSRFNDAIASGKVKRRMEAVTIDAWKKATLELGANRLASGLSAAKPKIVAFQTEFQPFQTAVTARTRAMPDTTIEDSINRMVNQVRETAKFVRRA